MKITKHRLRRIIRKTIFETLQLSPDISGLAKDLLENYEVIVDKEILPLIQDWFRENGYYDVLFDMQNLSDGKLAVRINMHVDQGKDDWY